nr:MAG TPA: hypothetical protein [Caudoviricetes sp.]
MANAYSTPLNYGRTITTTDTAQYIGAIQNAMQQKFDVNLAKIDDLIAKVSSVPLVRDKDKQYLGERLQGLLTMVDANSKVDLTDNTVARQITNYIGTAIDDNVKTQIANSKKIYQFNSGIQELKEKKHKEYNAANHAYALQKGGFDSYMAGDTDELGSLSYSPYTDVTETALAKIKELKELRGEEKVSMPDPNNPGQLIERSIKGLTREEIFKFMPNILTSKEHEQLKINGWAKYKDNIEEANKAVDMYKEDSYKDLEANIKAEAIAKDNTALSESDRAEAKARYESYQEQKKIMDATFSGLKKDDPESLGYFLEKESWKRGIADMAQAKWSVETKKDEYFFAKQQLDLDLQKNQREEEEHRAKMQKEYGIGTNGSPGAPNMSAYSESPMPGDLVEDFNPFENLKKAYQETNKEFNATINSAVNSDKTPIDAKNHYSEEMKKRGYDINGKVINKELASKNSLSASMQEAFNNSGLANIHPGIAKKVANLDIKRSQYSKEYNSVKETSLMETFKKDPDKYITSLEDEMEDALIDAQSDLFEGHAEDRMKRYQKAEKFVKANGGMKNLKNVISKDARKLEEFSEVLSGLTNSSIYTITSNMKRQDLKKDFLETAKSKVQNSSSYFKNLNVGTISGKNEIASVINKIPQTESGNTFDKDKPISFYKNKDGSMTITQNAGYTNTKDGGYYKKSAQVVVNSKDEAYIELSRYIDDSDKVDAQNLKIKVKPFVKPDFVEMSKRTTINKIGTTINNMPATTQRGFEVPPINYITKKGVEDVFKGTLSKQIPESKLELFTELLSKNLNDFSVEASSQDGGWAATVKDKNGGVVWEKDLGMRYLEEDTSYLIRYQPQIFISDALLKSLKYEPKNIDKYIKLMQ